jgi:hypothetical protein
MHLRLCNPFLRRLVEQDGLRVTWNKILEQEGARDPGSK